MNCFLLSFRNRLVLHDVIIIHIHIHKYLPALSFKIISTYTNLITAAIHIIGAYCISQKNHLISGYFLSFFRMLKTLVVMCCSAFFRVCLYFLALVPLIALFPEGNRGGKGNKKNCPYKRARKNRTGPFTISEPCDQEIDEIYVVVQKCRTTDFDAPKLRKGRS